MMQSTDDEEMDVDFGREFIFTRLTEMVRSHYFKHLKKQLEENIQKACGKNGTDRNSLLHNPVGADEIDACAKILEEKAIKACMMAQIYQRNMIKIIAKLRRSTDERRLEDYLLKIMEDCQHSVIPIVSNNQTTHLNKSTQTDVYRSDTLKEINTHSVRDPEDFTSLSLEQKMKHFQERFNRKENDSFQMLTRKSSTRGAHKENVKRTKYYEEAKARCKESTTRYKAQNLNMKPLSCLVVDEKPSVINAEINSTTVSPIVNQCSKPFDDIEDIDVVAKEMAQLFKEDITELDEIFGIDPNAEPDDPHINNILLEINSAKLKHEKVQNQSQPDTDYCENSYTPPATESTPVTEVQFESEQHKLHKNLGNSLWPCELFMQRHRLSKSLSILIEEDFRWHEIIKWKFSSFFGEDSDDEFGAISPSIELDDVLVSSCVLRISRWMVKHLMKPLREGLIANRFLFKKLAKKLAREIIMVNQYPDERFIKESIENFFCQHRTVECIEDLNDFSV